MCMENCNTNRKAGHATMEIGRSSIKAQRIKEPLQLECGMPGRDIEKDFLRKNEIDWACHMGK